MHPHNIKLIQLPLSGSRHKNLENANRPGLFHRICLGIPIIKLADHGYILCIRCPYSKIYTFLSAIRNRMGSQLLVNIIMRCLSKQILIQLCELHSLSHTEYLLENIY